MKFLKALLQKLYAYAVRYPVALALTVLLVVAFFFLLIGGKRIDFGGILGKIWGKKEPDPDNRNVAPPDRKDGSGQTIKPGNSDGEGFVQVVNQVEIGKTAIFSDPGKTEVDDPVDGKKDIKLPVGVKNDDVKQIVEIKPVVKQIENNDKGVDAGKLLKELGE